MPTDTWTEDRVEYLKTHWLKNTASQIAKALGGGITRNAIIGKAARLALPPKGGAWGKKKREK